MEGLLPGQQQQQQQEGEKDELETELLEEETRAAAAAAIKNVKLELLPSGEQQRRARRSRREHGVTVHTYDADIEVITFDSDDSLEFWEPELFRKRTQTPRRSSAVGGEHLSSVGGGRYSGRLRTRRPTRTKYNCDFFTHEELQLSDAYHGIPECAKSVGKQLQNVEALPAWGNKKSRTEPRSSCVPQQDSGRTRSKQETPHRDVLCRGSDVLQAGLTEWLRIQRSKISHQLHEGNVSSDNGTVLANSPLPSIGLLGSPSRKRSRLVGRGNMVTQTEVSPGELAGLHEGPATPMNPAARKRKAGILIDEFPEAHELHGLNHRHARSGSAARAVQQQYYDLSSEGEEATGHFRRAVEQTPQQSGNPVYDNIDAFLNGDYARQDPVLEFLDAFTTGELYGPSKLVNHGSQLYFTGRESTPPEGHDAHIGKGGVFPGPDKDGCSMVSEASTNDSPEISQNEDRHSSDEDYHPPVCQSKTDNVGTRIQTSYPHRSRRSLSFRQVGVTHKDEAISTLLSSPPATPTIGAQPLSTTPVQDTIPDNQESSLKMPIAPSMTGAGTEIVNVQEELEETLLAVDEGEAHGLFDLNELPEQPTRKNTKIRKKHRPKVFREGRPYRRRKPKNPEEEISKTKASEAKKAVEKPRVVRKKRTVIASKPDQADLEKQGPHFTSEAANCAPGIPGRVQCHEVLCVSGGGLGSHSQENPQTPASEYMLVRGPNNSLVAERVCSDTGSLPVRGGSPLTVCASATPNLSRKRLDEDERLTVSDGPVIRRGVRRELFKRARSKRSVAVVVPDLRSGEKSQELLNEATTHPAKEILVAGSSIGTDANHPQTLVHLESLERSMGEAALVDHSAIATEGVGTMVPSNSNPLHCEEGVSSESRIILADVHLQDKSTAITVVGGALPVKMRAAARAKFRNEKPYNRGKQPSSRRSSSMPRRRKTATVEEVVIKMADLELTENDSGLQLVPHVNKQTAMIPFMPARRKKPRAKVMLDGEDKRVWRLLMTQGTKFEDDSNEKDAPRQWEEERATMKARAEKFINRMHLVQGDRRFSVWKGSVVDSVVGAFLTQNVSDHLSSSAFMCLAARFPVPRKKESTAEASQETVVTEVRVEESFEISEMASGPLVSSDVTEAVPVFHVEEAFDVSEKSSATGGGLPMCCNQQVHNGGSIGWPNYAEQGLADAREQNSSCSSKDSESQCQSCVQDATPRWGESVEVRESEQQKTSVVVEGVACCHLEPGDVLTEPSSHSQMNSISSTALLDVGEREVTQMALPEPSSWVQTDSELVEGTLIVDLRLSADDCVMHTEPPPQSTYYGLHSLADDPTTRGIGGNEVPLEKNSSSGLPGLEVTCVSAEEVVASSGSVVSSSDSFDAQKPSQSPVVTGSEVTCVLGDEIGASTAGVICPLDSFDTNNSYDKQLVVPSAADIDSQLQVGLPYATESSNLHSLKSFMRKKIQVIRRVLKKKDPNVSEGNGTSGLGDGTGQEKEKVRGRKKTSVLGLTGIDRARLEESNITSKVAVDWEAVRLKYTVPEMGENQHESVHAGCKTFGSSHVENGVDWDAVRSAKLQDIADVIKERGMNNVLAGRIKAFLERVQKEHGSVDLEWLRTVSVEEAKSFLLSVRGLGLKSVECIRLLTLHHLAFPVDTNVGRICVRLGWVPLEPLPEELQLHLLELYPVQETIQKYLWPRLCSLDQRTLYELHYQMITFGKVFCTKSRPNCNACPMRDDCQHFASALASARLALPASANEDSHSTSEPLALPAAAAAFVEKTKLALPPAEEDGVAGEDGTTLPKLSSSLFSQKPCEPIVEEPSTPEPVVVNSTEIEDIEEFEGRDEEFETFVGVSSQPYGSDKCSSTDVEIILPPAEVLTPDPASKALVVLPPGSESIPVPKLKNIGRLRTVHYVYELPDNHPLVQGMDPREADDPCVYLLAIWSPGESPQAPPVLDDMHTNGSCDGFNSSEEEMVKGTVLVPCRTAMRGIFPLNGTYFQVNEVFADHASSLQPIEVPRTLLWNLRRRFVYFGTSVTTIFKGLSTEEIQACFWRGYVCVRGFDSVSRCPRPLAARLHFPASKMIRKPKGEKNDDEAQN